MTPTLLEFVIFVVLLVVAWQLGVAITPLIIQKVRGLKSDLDEVAEEIEADSTEKVVPIPKEEAGANHKYRNN